MNIALAIVTLAGITLVVSGQQGEKGNSIIPFPRVGRANGGQMSPGLIPFPRIGRDGSGLHEVKRQLIPFPRVGKRIPMMMPMYMDPLYAEYEAAQYAPWYDMSNDAMVSAGYSASDKDDNNIDIDKKNAATPNAGGGMWFGPRLGKRKKRSIESSESSSEHYRDALDTRTLVKILHNFNWAIVPIKERRTFTPRLGRGSGEISVHTRAQPLTPRLGRSREMVSAELDVEEDTPAAPRYARNEEHAAHGRSTQQPPIDVSGPPFSPRLGRADHYSTRSGRTGEDHE